MEGHPAFLLIRSIVQQSKAIIKQRCLHQEFLMLQSSKIFISQMINLVHVLWKSKETCRRCFICENKSFRLKKKKRNCLNEGYGVLSRRFLLILTTAEYIIHFKNSVEIKIKFRFNRIFQLKVLKTITPWQNTLFRATVFLSILKLSP